MHLNIHDVLLFTQVSRLSQEHEDEMRSILESLECLKSEQSSSGAKSSRHITELHTELASVKQSLHTKTSDFEETIK